MSAQSEKNGTCFTNWACLCEYARKHLKRWMVYTFYYQNLPILATFSREACLGRIKYLPLLALSYLGIPEKKFYYLSLWQITSKLNLILIIADYQCIRQICIRILIVSANYQQINLCSKRNAITLPKWLVCVNDSAKYLIKSSNFHHKQ